MIVVYALTLDLDGEQAVADADAKIKQLAGDLDPKTALVRRSGPSLKADYHAAGLLHGGEPRMPTGQSRFGGTESEGFPS